MKKNILPIALLTLVVIFIASCVKDRISTTGSVVTPPVNTSGDTLIHYWNCNEDTLVIMSTPTKSIVPGAGFSYAGARYDTAQTGTTLNGVGTDSVSAVSPDAALRLRNPSGAFTMKLPTTGYKNIVLKYAVERTSKGAQTNTVTYTTDGTNYINTAIANTSVYSVDTVFNVVSFDFSSDANVNNNPNFKVQINFSNATGTTTGNDRFDNFTVYGVKQ